MQQSHKHPSGLPGSRSNRPPGWHGEGESVLFLPGQGESSQSDGQRRAEPDELGGTVAGGEVVAIGLVGGRFRGPVLFITLPGKGRLGQKAVGFIVRCTYFACIVYFLAHDLHGRYVFVVSGEKWGGGGVLLSSAVLLYIFVILILPCMGGFLGAFVVQKPGVV